METQDLFEGIEVNGALETITTAEPNPDTCGYCGAVVGKSDRRGYVHLTDPTLELSESPGDFVTTLHARGDTVNPADVVDNSHRMSPAEAEKAQGCWLEGSRGWTASGELVNIAAHQGMPLSDDDRALVDAYLGRHEGDLTLPSGDVVSADDLDEYVTGQGAIADQAAQWLTDNVAPDGWSFGWYDGEFFLQTDEWWQEATA